jgi:hypothetical protein
MTSTLLNQDSVRKSRDLVPYVTSWSAEQDLLDIVVERRGTGIAYLEESIHDRHGGVLWYRVAHNPGNGRPDFKKVHPARQRRAMIRLLCQVCGGDVGRTVDGVLWLMALGETDDGNWPDYPEGVAAVEPPTCSACVRKALRMCPALRQGAIVFRVKECPVVGVRGALYDATVAGCRSR